MNPNLNDDALDQRIAEKFQELNGATAEQPIELNIGGTTLKYNTKEELEGAIGNIFGEYQRTQAELAQARQAQQAAPPPQAAGQRVTGEEVVEPFSKDTFAKLFVEDPTEATRYAFKYTPEYKEQQALKARLAQQEQFQMQQYQQQQVQQFAARNQDYVTYASDPRINQAITAVMQQTRTAPTAEGYELAWNFVKNRYNLGGQASETGNVVPFQQPAPVQQQRLAPPTARRSGVTNTPSEADAWNMDMDTLRQLADVAARSQNNG
jgi:hypothetical protein